MIKTVLFSNLIFVVVSTLLLTTTAMAQDHNTEQQPVRIASDTGMTRFVATSGVDQGACTTANKPCRSLKYAINQSARGDRIRVAAGTFTLPSSDIFYLLNDLVQIRGGFDASKGFQKSATDQPGLTKISGLPARYRAPLAAKGFQLMAADRQRVVPMAQRTAQEGAIYRTITSNAIISAQNCSNGMAAEFPCNDFDLQAHMPLTSFSSLPASANDIWGFVDLNDMREYALIGLSNGTAIVDVTVASAPQEVGFIEGAHSTWRDLKVYQFFDSSANRYKAYAYVTSEGFLGGMQVIDLTGLPTSVTLANDLTDFFTAHNIYIANVDYSSGLNSGPFPAEMIIAGSNLDSGAFRVLSLTDPLNPALLIAPPVGTGYMHDVVSHVFSGSQASTCAAGHDPCEVMADFNETTIDLWDITDASAPAKLSSTTYSSVGYAHSGWWSDNGKYLFAQDELDEEKFGLNTTLRVFNTESLTQPVLAGSYVGPTKAIDHNGFVVGNRYYMSNYRRGLTVLDISNPTTPIEVGFFDTFPSPAENDAKFNGAWGVYPFLPSGNILVSDIEGGLFVISETATGATPDPNPGTPPATSPSSSSGGGSISWWLFALMFASFYLRPVKKSA